MHAPDFWNRPQRGWQARALSPLAALYTWGGRWRMASTAPAKAAVPVLCVGNLTLGGTGKTPVAIALCEMLKADGQKPFFLTRGYGGTEKGPLRVDPARHTAQDVGDEPLLLAEAAPVIVARDRVAGAARAAHEGASLIIMDDGFQNPTLAKTASVLVIDGAARFGNGAVFPAGPLREPVAQGLMRAQGLIVMGGTSPPEVTSAVLPCFQAHLVPDPQAAARFRDQRVFAFAGIGRPAKFFSTLKDCGALLAGTQDFPDHFAFSENDIATLKARAAALDALPVTTAKDLVRLPAALRDGIAVLPVRTEFSAPGEITGFLRKHFPSAC